MANSKVLHVPILTEEREMTDLQTSTIDIEEYEEDKFDKHFWKEVRNKIKMTGMSYNKAMDHVRIDRLKAKMEKYGKDPLFVMIDKWPKMFLEKYQRERKHQKPEQQLPSLEYLISRLTEIILEQDTNKKYKFYRVEEEEAQPTLLHLAAEQNFLHVSRCLVNYYPNLLNLRTYDEKCALPVELALKKHQDDTAAYLISQMTYDNVKKLFLRDEGSTDQENEEVFFFGNIISYRNPKTNEYGMKRTVKAVLDKLINPRWPYLPDRREEDEADEEIARALESVPDDPMNYDFEYHILETDENGRTPSQQKFNHNSVSCLRRIADSENKEAVQHPVVRMLVSRKWNNFAHKWFCLKAFLYVLFLLVLSFALIYGSTREDPTQYKNSGDKLRVFCEICSIILLMFHLFDEIGEIAREGGSYFEVWHNYLDMFGIILTFLVLPLRYAESKSQWTVASLGYIFNVLRLFKFSSVTRFTGLYTTTLVKIIHKDISRFMLVFSVIFIGFCGAMFIALKVDDLQDSFSNFASLMLAGFRALVEQQAVEEDYSKFGWLTILILLSYMGVVIVVLLNVLIAQLSYTYSEAKRIARLQYAADTMRIISRLEYSRFASLNLRVRNYKPGDWISDEDLATEILEYNEERHPWENAEDRITSVREIMRKIVRKGKQKEPWDTLDEKLTHLTSIMEKLPESK